MIIRRDKNNILRVHRKIEEHSKTPPAYTRNDSDIYQKYIHMLHKNLGHPNTRTLIRQTQRIFWTKSIASDAKKVSRECIICMKTKPKAANSRDGSPTKHKNRKYITIHTCMDRLWGSIEFNL
jgi:Integrase zinc binding domain